VSAQAHASLQIAKPDGAKTGILQFAICKKPRIPRRIALVSNVLVAGA
jgi:hypothetical protein